MAYKEKMKSRKKSKYANETWTNGKKSKRVSNEMIEKLKILK